MTASVKPPPRSARNQKRTKPAKNKRAVGSHFESQACQFLQNKNFQCLEHNVRCGRYELDLVMLDRPRNEVVFVEVKYRQHTYLATVNQVVDWRQWQRIQRAAQMYMRREDIDLPYRVDLVAICPGRVEHLVNLSFVL